MRKSKEEKDACAASSPLLARWPRVPRFASPSAALFFFFFFLSRPANSRRAPRAALPIPHLAARHISQTHREQMELSVRSALTALPEAPYGGGDDDAECSLCMESLIIGEMVRTLPSCGHAYHSKCIDRWLLDGQAHQRRRCPLCNTDPVETVAITCPPGVVPGDQIRVHHHADYDVTVPSGVLPGQIFHTNLPARLRHSSSSCSSSSSGSSGTATAGAATGASAAGAGAEPAAEAPPPEGGAPSLPSPPPSLPASPAPSLPSSASLRGGWSLAVGRGPESTEGAGTGPEGGAAVLAAAGNDDDEAGGAVGRGRREDEQGRASADEGAEARGLGGWWRV